MTKQFILVNARNDMKKIFLNDVIYIKTRGRKVRLRTVNNTMEYYTSVVRIFPQLGNNIFICHTRLIINFDKIKGMSNNEITFINGDSVTVGTTNLRRTKKAYKNYLENLLAAGSKSISK